MPHLPPDSSPHPPYGAPDPQDPYAPADLQASYDPTGPQPPYAPTASPPPPHLTYPWQPPAPAPQPAAPSPRRAPAPGHRGDLRQLRGAYRRQRRVATLTALGSFTLFLLLSAFAPALMTAPVTGGLTTGLLAGLLQLPVMCLATVVYEITARRRLDRLAARLRTHLEREASRA
ncbi:DUF485 domain-containing protein [Streptomyces sp. MNP-20]|uniref:DUF485 domain-containing protein n=1 Tax=Streptomyces sp. MNP-20 TaxID=2721165 RepID=UPI00155476D5|nr:DUF485 domain-containing protein [Streptomyces sp. MNP-20]